MSTQNAYLYPIRLIIYCLVDEERLQLCILTMGIGKIICMNIIVSSIITFQKILHIHSQLIHTFDYDCVNIIKYIYKKLGIITNDIYK